MKVVLKSNAYEDRWFLMSCGAKWSKTDRRWYLVKPTQKQLEKLAQWVPDDLLMKESSNEHS